MAVRFSLARVPGSRRYRALLAAGAATAVTALVAGCGPKSPATSASRPATPAAPQAGPSQPVAVPLPTLSVPVPNGSVAKNPCGVLSRTAVGSALHIRITQTAVEEGVCEYRTAGWQAGAGEYDLVVVAQPDAASYYQQLIDTQAGSSAFRHVKGPWKDGIYAQQGSTAITMSVLTDTWVVSTTLGGAKLIGTLAPDRYLTQLSALCGSAVTALDSTASHG